MGKAAYVESAIILTPLFFIRSPNTSTYNCVYADVFATKAGGEYMDGSCQAAMLKIRHLELFKHTLDDGLTSSWTTEEWVNIPLSMQHIVIAVSTQRANGSGRSHLGRIERDIDSLLNISLSSGIDRETQEDLSGWKCVGGVGLRCVVMSVVETMSFNTHEHGYRQVEDKRERKISTWLEQESNKQQRFEVLRYFYIQRFGRTHEISDIDLAIAYGQETVKMTPDGDTDKPGWLNNLGMSLRTRFECLGNLDDLNESILTMEKAVQGTPDGHPDKPSRLGNLGTFLWSRFERLGNLNDLNESILVMEKAVEITPDGHPDKPSRLNNLADSLRGRFQHVGDLNNLNKSILVQDKAVKIIPDGHPHKPLMLNNFGTALLSRFGRLGDLNDLNESILMMEKAVQLTPDGHLYKPSMLNNFGESLLSRFSHLGNLDDLNKSILLWENAVRLTPDGHPDMPSRLKNLGSSLLTRFERLGNLNDLNESIQLKEKAVRLTLDGHPDMPSRLNSLGYSLLTRFERLGNLNDLNESILVINKAVQFTPDGHPDMLAMLNNLGVSLRTRFERLGNLNDLNESILVKEKAVRLTPDGHPDIAARLNNLGTSLLRRFDRLGSLNDLNESILVKEKDVRLTPDDHPDMPSRLSSLGVSLLTRFERLGNLNDLNESILVVEKAVRLTPNGHPDKPSMLNNLGSSLLMRFERFGNHNDRTNSLKCYSSASLAVIGHPSIQFRASSGWALLAEDVNDNVSRFKAYSTALSHLPRLAWLGSRIQDRHFDIKQIGDVIRRAAAAAIENGKPETSVEWLEQGRSIIWGQLLQLRIPIDELLSSYPSLGQKLHTLSSQLEGVNIAQQSPLSTSSMLQILPDYHAIAHERELLINQIRQLPGFEHFLLPKSCSALTRVAQLGAVVVLNATGRRCDAFALVPGLDDDVLHIPLPEISLNEVEVLGHDLRQLIQNDSSVIDVLFNRYRNIERLGATLVSSEGDFSYQEKHDKIFQGILLQVWNCVIEPVVQGLGLATHTPSRIWWCPTGPFSFLPLHAAGNYSPDALVGSKLMDYAISSYTPSLALLIQALDSAPTILSEAPRLLVIAQSSSTGQAYIPGTLQELKFIKDLAALNNNVAVKVLNGSDVTVSRVKEEMGNTSWAHFACHGVQDGNNPTQSALLLSGDSRLTLSEIIGMNMPSKDFAFLSACQTGTGDKELSDESVHLAAGMLSAGYRGVIATMWSISDWYAPTVAKDVYTHLFKKQIPDSTDAAEALHYAVKNLQQKPDVSFVDWVPFIHMGL